MSWLIFLLHVSGERIIWQLCDSLRGDLLRLKEAGFDKSIKGNFYLFGVGDKFK